MTALRPGASPPPVEIAMLHVRFWSVRASTRSRAARRLLPASRDGRSSISRKRGRRRRAPRTARHRDGISSTLSIGKPLTNLGRQTGGPRFVVSHRAVFDRDRHGRKASASPAAIAGCCSPRRCALIRSCLVASRSCAANPDLRLQLRDVVLQPTDLVRGVVERLRDVGLGPRVRAARDAVATDGCGEEQTRDSRMGSSEVENESGVSTAK